MSNTKNLEQAVIVNMGSSLYQSEFTGLVVAANINICHEFIFQGRKIDSANFISKGKLEEIKAYIQEQKIETLIINTNLSPTQERNLSQFLCVKVIDRTGLILDIFAQRAQTYEAKLQIELAQLQHLSTRLKGVWTHLERQKGGIGLRGPGETQLETDRRLIGFRIKRIKSLLKKVSNTRAENRKSRQKNSLVLALAGYTNAGKSSLFNSLSKDSSYAKDQLFATLDPKVKQVYLPNYPTVCIADTVGFIEDLPLNLVKAFKATLEEIVYADIILLVVDVNDVDKLEKIQVVTKILAEIGAKDIPVITVYNKIDVQNNMAKMLLKESTAYLSALNDEHIKAFKVFLQQFLEEKFGI